MKVLWISNVLFPEVCIELNMPIPSVGGWMYSGAKGLLDSSPEIKLAVASLYRGDDLKLIDKSGIKYYLIPSKKDKTSETKDIEISYKKITKDFKPDIVHLHGSEYPHSLSYIKSCGTKNVVVSIQGLVSVYSKYYLGGINKKAIVRFTTLRDYFRLDTLLSQQRNMERRGEKEMELLRLVEHVIGRTSWDNSHTWALNPKRHYHFCNETLRDEFYSGSWSYEQCEKFTLFLSQGHYPIKGLHQVIKAVSLVAKKYPKIKINIAGSNFLEVSKIKRNGYANYLNYLMSKYGLRSNFQFLGVLNAKQMKEEYLKAHIFVCPSIIENSPNSVGEAQLLGTPCISTYVGGSMDMIESGSTGILYRFEEVELLAKYICDLFEDRDKVLKLSLNSRKVANVRHNKKVNANNLYEIYKSIINDI